MPNFEIGLGVSAIKEISNPFSSKKAARLLSIIAQHRVILSNKIILYYMEHADTYADIIQTYINTIIMSADMCSIHEDTNCVNGAGELCYLVAQSELKVLVSDINESNFKKKNNIHLVSLIDVFENYPTELTKFTFPVTNYIAKAYEPCNKYTEWFGKLLKGQKKIDIIDKYILQKGKLSVLKKYYFPLFDKGAEVNIYCGQYEVDVNSVVNDLQDAFFSNWNVNVYLCTNMHDRMICTNKYQISIGGGLDFLPLSGTLKRDCMINITDQASTYLRPQIIKEIMRN